MSDTGVRVMCCILCKFIIYIYIYTFRLSRILGTQFVCIIGLLCLRLEPVVFYLHVCIHLLFKLSC